MKNLTSEDIDVHVGQRVRSRRNEIQITQDNLAQAIGITFQQIQKYERGTNRISASRLFNIAAVLKVPVSYFFEGLPEFYETGATSGEAQAAAFLQTQDGIMLASWVEIMTPAKRRLVLSLVKGLSSLD